MSHACRQPSLTLIVVGSHYLAITSLGANPAYDSELLRLLAITKQSLGRVLNDLTNRELVTNASGELDRRQKLLRLTKAGAALEAELFECFREGLSAAYARAGQDAVTGFWRVLEGLIPVEDRALALELSRKG